jgi:predicted metalloprotease with PDZ domain
MKTNLNSVWNASASVRSTYTQDGGVLLDVEKGMCYSLNAVASKLWNHLEQNQDGVTFDDLVKVIRSNFEVTDNALETDIAAHLEKLEKMGLVRRSVRVA